MANEHRTPSNPTGQVPLFTVEVWRGEAAGFQPLMQTDGTVAPFYDRATANAARDKFHTARVVDYYSSAA
jgi:hypothetical protein